MTAPLKIRVAVTGLTWMGGSVGSVDTAVRDIITLTRRELVLVSYELRTDALHLVDLMRERLDGGIVAKIVVNRLETKPFVVQQVLERLSRDYPRFEVYSFSPPNEGEDLHAKLLIADREHMLVGSANLSWRGLVKNHEIAVRLDGPEVSIVASAVDRLFASEHVKRVWVPRPT